MRVLRVATLNVWNRSGPWAERLRLIRDELGRLDADVVGLQEVMRLVRPGTLEPLSPDHDQAHEIANGFDYEIGYAGASDYGNGLIMGNAVLSRFPLFETRSFRLPDRGLLGNRLVRAAGRGELRRRGGPSARPAGGAEEG